MPTLSAWFYWRNLCSDIREFVRTCKTCLISPVYPLPVPSRPFQQWCMDYKTLARSTVENNRHILVFICHFQAMLYLFRRRIRQLKPRLRYLYARLWRVIYYLTWFTPIKVRTSCLSFLVMSPKYWAFHIGRVQLWHPVVTAYLKWQSNEWRKACENIPPII